MSEVTMFIAQILGPVLIVLGIGIVLSPKYYERIYFNLESEHLALLVASIAAMTGGLAIILTHNVWGTGPEIAVSALGWIVFLKGVALGALPRYVTSVAHRFVGKGMMPVGGVIVGVIGAYLAYVSYFV